jgi:CheY-like chemotaxis protein
MEVRKLPGYQSTPVIFLSAADRPEAMRKNSDYNISAWFNKPVDINQLSDTINKTLAQ